MVAPAEPTAAPRLAPAPRALIAEPRGCSTPALGSALAAHWRYALAGLLGIVAVAWAAALLWPRPAPPLAIVTPTPRPTASPAPPVIVHVIGEVVNPGVYRLPSGSRAEQAVALAGGLTPDADPASLNLAAPLIDGQQVNVKSRLQPLSSAPSAPVTGALPPPGKLDLNRATLAELDLLPGIGPVLAQRIVDRRQRSGPFQSIEQLRDEKLVPGATYERIKDLVTVS